MTTSDDWDREFRPPAADTFEALDTRCQDRIVDKLDEIMTDEWRKPHEHIEPLSGMPHRKILVGDYWLGAAADRVAQTLVVCDIEHRSGAYKPGDDV